MRHIPEDILYNIADCITTVPSKSHVSAFRLTNTACARVGQSLLYGHVVLRSRQRAKELHYLWEHNQQLFNATVALDIGHHRTGIDEAEDLWAWPCTFKGMQLLDNLDSIWSLSMSSLSIRSVVDAVESKMYAVRNIASFRQLRRVNIRRGTFTTVSLLWAFAQVFHSVRSLAVHQTVISIQMSSSSDALEPQRTTRANLLSLSLCNNWHIKYTHLADMVNLMKTGNLLDNLQSLAIHCLYPRHSVEVITLFNHVSPSLRHLSIHLENSINPTQVPQKQLAPKPMPHLDTLAFSGMTQNNLTVVAGAFRAIVPHNHDIVRLTCDIYLDTKSYFDIGPLQRLDELALHAQNIEIDMTMRLRDVDLKDPSIRSAVAQLLMPRNFEKRSSDSVCWIRIAQWGDSWPCEYERTSAGHGNEDTPSPASSGTEAISLQGCHDS